MQPKSLIRRFSPLSTLLVAGLLAPQVVHATAYTWTPTAEGSYHWNNADSQNNWTSGFPNAAADVANLNIDLLGAQLINLNQAITVLTLNMGDTGNTYYSTTLAAGTGGALTMAASGTIAKSTTTNDVDDTISADITLSGDLTVNNKAVAASGGIILSGTVSGATRTLTKKGRANLYLNGNTTLGGLAVSDQNTGSAGTVKVGSGHSLTVNGGSTKDFVVRSNTGATLDVSEASSLSADVGNFWIGGFGTGWSGTLNLGVDNTITAATAFRIGDGNVGSTTATGTITTPADGTTTIHTPVMKIGYVKTNIGSFTLGSGHTLNLDGPSDGRTQLIVGDSAATDSKAQGTLNLADGIASLKLSSATIAKDFSSTGSVTLGSDIANHLDISGTGTVVLIGANSRATNTSVGALTIGNLNDSSKIETTTEGATAIILGQKTAAGGASGTLNLNGGTLTIATSGAAIAGGGGTSELYLGNTAGNGSGMTLKVGAASTASSWITGLSAARIKSTGVTFDTNSYDIAIDQALLTDAVATGGGLTKDGTGSLTLGSASNSYTGATMVSNGTLKLGATASLATSGVEVAAGAVFDTTAQAYAIPADKPLTLHLNPADSGSSGKIAGGVLKIENATVVVTIDSGTLDDNLYVLADYTSLDGANSFLSVTPPPDGYRIDYAYHGNQIVWIKDAGYGSWAMGLSNPVLSNTAADADPDGDGLSNAIEYVLGTDPRYFNRGGPQADAAGADFVFTFSRSDSSETPDVTLVVEVSDDLVDWTTHASYAIGADREHSDAGVTILENEGDPDTIRVTVPKDGHTKMFGRLRAVVSGL